MSNLQTFVCLILGAVVTILLSVLLVLVFPFSHADKVLSAAFLFPLICSFYTVLIVRGFKFSSFVKMSAGLIGVAVLIIITTGPMV